MQNPHHQNSINLQTYSLLSRTESYILALKGGLKYHLLDMTEHTAQQAAATYVDNPRGKGTIILKSILKSINLLPVFVCRQHSYAGSLYL